MIASALARLTEIKWQNGGGIGIGICDDDGDLKARI